MDGYYQFKHSTSNRANGFDEVDRFLKGSTSNVEFWRNPAHVYYEFPNDAPFVKHSQDELYSEKRHKHNAQSQFSNFTQQAASSADLKNTTYTQPSLNYYQLQHPEQCQQQDLLFHHLPEKSLSNPFLQTEKQRKLSAFKSLRSYLKKHLRILNANHSYKANKKTSSLSLYNSSKPAFTSNYNINNSTNVYPLPENELISAPLTRAHSFSASKMRSDFYPGRRSNTGSSTAYNSRSSARIPSDSPKIRVGSSALYYPDSEKQNTAVLSSISKSLFASRREPRSPIKPSVSSLRPTQSSHLRSSPKITPTTLGSIKNFSSIAPAIMSTSINSTDQQVQDGAPIETINRGKVETPCVNGILNHGNTCYMNAILQCLACIDRFAEYFVCQKFENTSLKVLPILSLTKNSVTVVLASILQSLWFNVNADDYCLQLIMLIANANPHFQFSSQQDAQESLIWILDKIHEEIKDNRLSRTDPSVKLYKSEEQLASDALKRVSGSNRSAIMDLFRAQFRSSMECSSCGFSNLTFDPYMTVSLSVPQPKNIRFCSAIFVSYFNPRRLVRYKINVSVDDYFEVNNQKVSSILHVKEKIASSIGGSTNNLIVCKFAENGLCSTFEDDVLLDAKSLLSDYTIIEIPKLNEQHESQHDIILAVVSHVSGYFPTGSRRGEPYVVVLNRQWSYERITKTLLENGCFLLRKSYFPVYPDFKLLLQHSSDGVLCLDHGVSMPLFNEWNSINNRESILRIIIEWNSSVAPQCLNDDSEPIVNDFNGQVDESAVTLLNLLQDYIKTETVTDWKCPKCFKCSGKKELMFHSMPPVLVFHLKRFESLYDGATKKVDTRVQIPLESLDMTPYICNPDSRFNTLKSTSRKNSNRFNGQKDAYELYPLYDLVGVVYHHGERANSGHYTATTRNPIDNRWRNFDDVKVTMLTNTDDICLANNAYLLFYERKSSLSSINSPKSLPNPVFSSRWFTCDVPALVIAQCEERRWQSCDVPESRVERLRNEIDEFSVNDDKLLIKPIQSGSSIFYTGTAIENFENPKESSEIAHRLYGNSTNEKYGFLPYNSVLSRSYTENNDNAYQSKEPKDDLSSLPCSKTSSYYYRDYANNNNTTAKSPSKLHYYESPTHSSNSRPSVFAPHNHQRSGMIRELSTEPRLAPTLPSLYVNDSRNSNYQSKEPKNELKYRMSDYTPSTPNCYPIEYSTLPTKRSKSYQALSNSPSRVGNQNTSDLYSGYNDSVFSAYDPYHSFSSSRKRAELRNGLDVSAGSQHTYADELSKGHFLSAYRH